MQMYVSMCVIFLFLFLSNYVFLYMFTDDTNVYLPIHPPTYLLTEIKFEGIAIPISFLLLSPYTTWLILNSDKLPSQEFFYCRSGDESLNFYLSIRQKIILQTIESWFHVSTEKSIIKTEIFP